MAHFQKLAEDGSHGDFNWSRHRPTLVVSLHAHAGSCIVS
jgi:hypothetical protein